MKRLLARWVFPVDQPPIERGIVEIVDATMLNVTHNTKAMTAEPN